MSARSSRFSSAADAVAAAGGHALLADAVDEPAVVLQRVRAAHRFEAFDQHLVVGVQKEDARFDAQIIEMAQHGGQVGEIIARSHVDDSGEPVHAAG